MSRSCPIDLTGRQSPDLMDLPSHLFDEDETMSIDFVPETPGSDLRSPPVLRRCQTPHPFTSASRLVRPSPFMPIPPVRKVSNFFQNRHDHKIRQMVYWHPDAVFTYLQQYKADMSSDDIFTIVNLFPVFWKDQGDHCDPVELQNFVDRTSHFET